MKPHIESAHALFKKHLKEDSLVVDATCGNGYDTLYLATLVPKGHVYSYDIQPQALETMGQKKGTLPITPFNKSHTDFSDLPGKITLFAYNLGYLPGGNKEITTKSETTLESIKKALSLLDTSGVICITCYPGHEEGEREASTLIDFVKELDRKQYLVEVRQWINRLKSPFLIVIWCQD